MTDNNPYGADILIDEYGDLAHSSGFSDVMLVSGEDCVKQDLANRALRLMLNWIMDDLHENTLRAREKEVTRALALHPMVEPGSVFVVMKVSNDRDTSIEAAIIAKTKSGDQIAAKVAA